MNKYIAICTWVEEDKTQWDCLTDLTSEEDAQAVLDVVSWDGPNMNQKFSVISEQTYLKMLKDDSE